MKELMSPKFNYVDGIWHRDTHYGKHKISITVWRTPRCWEAKARCEWIGNVTSGGSNPMEAIKSSLLNLRLNIPIWSQPDFGIL